MAQPTTRNAGGTAGDLDLARSYAPPEAAEVKRLTARYDRPGPRYTSYPTVPVWTDDFGPDDTRRALAGARDEEISLYLHVPFCERLCTYCACNRVISRDHAVVGPYLADLEREAELVAEAMGGARRCVQLAIGGGTPTYLDASELGSMLEFVDRLFPPDPGAERSIEVDPRVTTREHLELLAERRFNRISLGVQDLSPRVQKAIHRIQPIEETERTAADARELGFGSVNFDLIYGLPYQTVESFSASIDEVIRLRPDRIALYSYAHVTWVSKQQRGFEKKDLPGPDEKLAIFLVAIRKLTDAGYLYFGLDHFALPDDELSRAAARGELHRNFMGYTTRASRDLVGLGPSAISELSGAYAQSRRSLEEWSQQLAEGELPTQRGWWLSDDDQRRRFVIQSLMCRGELDFPDYADRFGEALEDRVPGAGALLQPFVDDGLLQEGDGRYRVTPLGRLFLRPIAMTFDAYLEPADPSRPLFSRTV